MYFTIDSNFGSYMHVPFRPYISQRRQFGLNCKKNVALKFTWKIVALFTENYPSVGSRQNLQFPYFYYGADSIKLHWKWTCSNPQWITSTTNFQPNTETFSTSRFECFTKKYNFLFFCIFIDFSINFFGKLKPPKSTQCTAWMNQFKGLELKGCLETSKQQN